ncbi:MAG TPA: hypothetical protein VJA22_00035, partial [Patescibacteria group bacterium]|nr:hypothetical protein [Patescibacteria group bacterium]
MLPVDVYLTLRQKWTDPELESMYVGYDPVMLKDWVVKFVVLFFRSIFKWVQAPNGIHLGNLDLDYKRSFQFPDVSSVEWLDLKSLKKMQPLMNNGISISDASGSKSRK